MLEPIAVIGPIECDIELLKEQACISSQKRIANSDFYKGMLHGKNVVFVRGGLGKVSCAMAVQALIDFFNPISIIATGAAGALSSDLNVGDVVICKSVLVYDLGYVTREGFISDGIPFYDENGTRYKLQSITLDEHLLQIAKSAMNTVNLESRQNQPKIVVDNIVTGDMFIDNPDEKRRLHSVFNAVATEREGAAIAQVALANHIPCLIIRGISDNVDESVLNLSNLIIYANQTDFEKSKGTKNERIKESSLYQEFRNDIEYAARNAALLVDAIIQNL